MKTLLALLSAAALAISMAAPVAAQGMGQDTTGLGPGGSGASRNYVVRDWGRHQRRGNHHRRGFYSQGGHGWYNGHRGYRHRRPGYREHNGWWFPAAILGGAIIGNAIVNQPSRGNSHVQWCYDRYRSYRASDNTFQPYNGPRQQCVSPY